MVNKATDKHDVFIGRPSIFGNPFVIGTDGTRREVIQKYKQYFDNRIRTDIQFQAEVERLRGLKLGCYCKPKACHGDIIALHLNSRALF